MLESSGPRCVPRMPGMLHTENRIVVHAPPETVYAVAADVAAWPEILPHYRYVRVLVDGDRGRTVEMSARRSGIPVAWGSRQELLPDRLQVRYHHIAGVTRGMDVLWTVESGPDGTVVTIDHDLDPQRWWLRPRISRYIVGTMFVMHIADRTLRGVKRRAEILAGESPTP